MTVAVIVLGLIPALIVLVLAILARVASNRAPASPGPQFAPLAGATVLDDALLLDADDRAAAAMLVDMAVGRRIRLLAEEPDGTGRRARRRTPVGVEIVEGAEFGADELKVLEAVLGDGAGRERVRRLSSSGRALAHRVRVVLDGARERLQAAGMLRPGRRHWPVALLRAAAVILLLWNGFLLIAALAEGPSAASILLGCGMLVCLAALVVVPRAWRTFLPASDPARAHLAGLREYMALAEAEPLRFLQSTEGALLSGDVSADAAAQRLQRFLLNERLLPYAVLFGMERSWAQLVRVQSDGLPAVEGVGDVLEATALVLQVIELIGDAVQLVGAVVDLGEAFGGVAELAGGLLDA